MEEAATKRNRRGEEPPASAAKARNEGQPRVAIAAVQDGQRRRLRHQSASQRGTRWLSRAKQKSEQPQSPEGFKASGGETTE